MEQYEELTDLAADAVDAGDRGRAAKLNARALPYAAAAGPSATFELAQALSVQVGNLYRVADLEGAVDCGARALAVLQPPHRFYPAALATLTHAAWRDCPLDATDTAVTLPPEVVERAVRELLSTVYGALGNAYSRNLRVAEAIAHYEQALVALELQPPGFQRDLQAASLQGNLGNQYSRLRQPARAAQHNDAMRVLLDAAERAGADAEVIRCSRANLALNVMHGQPGGAAPSGSPALAALEALWHEQRLSDVPTVSVGPSDFGKHVSASVCISALQACSTPAQQRPWLERMLALPLGPLSATPAARLAGQPAFRGSCRACAMPADQVAVAGGKLRACVACKGVAYCSVSCQRADWKRHRVPCGAQAAALAMGGLDAAAALEDATCIICRRGLAPQPGGDAEPELVHILKCGHVGHSRCINVLVNALPFALSASCPTCDTPIDVGQTS